MIIDELNAAVANIAELERMAEALVKGKQVRIGKEFQVKPRSDIRDILKGTVQVVDSVIIRGNIAWLVIRVGKCFAAIESKYATFVEDEKK